MFDKLLSNMSTLDAVPVLSGVTGGFVGFIGFMYGYESFMSLGVLLVCMALDQITGISVAFTQKKLSSKVGYKGVCRKVATLFVISLAHLLSNYILNVGDTLTKACIYFYIANEGISLIENASLLGVRIPKKLKDALAQLQDKEEEPVESVEKWSAETKEADTK